DCKRAGRRWALRFFAVRFGCHPRLGEDAVEHISAGRRNQSRGAARAWPQRLPAGARDPGGDVVVADATALAEIQEVRTAGWERWSAPPTLERDREHTPMEGT